MVVGAFVAAVEVPVVAVPLVRVEVPEEVVVVAVLPVRVDVEVLDEAVEVVVVRNEVEEVEVELERPEVDEVVAEVAVVPLEVRVVPERLSTSVRNCSALRTDTPEALAVLVTRRSKELSGCATA